MPFYEVIIQASQTLYVEADSEDEALDVACTDYSSFDFEFDEGRLGEVTEEEPLGVKVLYK
jgi:hypothetical protein